MKRSTCLRSRVQKPLDLTCFDVNIEVDSEVNRLDTFICD